MAVLQASSADPTAVAGFARLQAALSFASPTALHSILLSGHFVFYFCIFLYTCAYSLEASSIQHTHLKTVLGGRQIL